MEVAGLLVAAYVSVSTPNKPSELTLTSIEAKLFYEESGRLSPDLLSRPKPFEGWNTIIGEGDAEEQADDLLVIVKLAPSGGAAHNQKMIESPLLITVHNGAGKLVTQRKFDHLLTGDDGKTSKPLWLTDIGCSGDLKIVARYNGKQKSALLPLHCGE